MANKKKNSRSVINTTIDTNVLNAFKEYCWDMGCPMNMILEAFMGQFADGQFILKIGNKYDFEVELDE